jgi:hypothetical protein
VVIGGVRIPAEHLRRLESELQDESYGSETEIYGFAVQDSQIGSTTDERRSGDDTEISVGSLWRINEHDLDSDVSS